DVSALSCLFEDPSVTKVLHGADYDIRCLFRDFGFTVASLFDTQLAARFLGQKETGLSSVISRYFGVDLEKKYQKSNWALRPIPREMLSYAVLDTAFLPELRALLSEELEKLGRASWVEEECGILCQARPSSNGDSPLFLRFKGAGLLDPLSLAVLEEVLQVRVGFAKSMDRPVFKVFSDTAALAMAQEKPRNMEALAAIPNFSGRQIQIFGAKVLAGIEKALQTPKAELPRYPRKQRFRCSPHEAERKLALRDFRDRKAAELSLDPGIVLTNSQMRAVAKRKRTRLEELSAIPDLRRWQVSAMGEEMLETLSRVP
ncbi:MAG: HRDC domain-containing protein, partial [Thermodesulfobacteriota bacterium]